MALRLLGGLSLVAAGVVTWYGYRLLRLVGCEGATLVIGTAILLGSPLLFISAYGPDADILLAAILSAFIYHLTRLSARHELMAAPGAGSWAMLGILAGLAMATKYSGLTALLTAGAISVLALAVGRNRARVARHGLIVLVVAVAIGSWKYIDNIERHGTPLFANGSASEGLALSLPASVGHYEFTTLRLADLWALFGLRSEEGELTTFPVYRSVVTTLHAQAWSDMSFFSVPSRHGAPGSHYVPRRVPIWLVKSVVLLGFVPEVLAVLGVAVTIRRREFWPMGIFTAITLAAYVVWFLPQAAWALKTKYLLGLAAPVTVYAMAGQDWLWRRVRPLGWVTAALLIALVLVGHVYLYAFAAGRM
jgi:4-amino-4-deoxy-L-arabinose transferase-like glycosyltransferase